MEIEDDLLNDEISLKNVDMKVIKNKFRIQKEK
jgi:hypothetical protein